MVLYARSQNQSSMAVIKAAIARNYVSQYTMTDIQMPVQSTAANFWQQKLAAMP